MTSEPSPSMFTYRVDKTYDWNYEHGPEYAADLPDVPEIPAKEFLGFRVNSRLGISAGLLLNSRWIELYGRLGFDLLTYKTVRLRQRECFPLPNWVFIDHHGQLDPDDETPLVCHADTPPATTSMTSSVSFGMPSKGPETWCADVARARKVLQPGQLLNVSVVASPEPDAGDEMLIDEFGELARLAVDAGADIVEANLSCPNVCTPEGQIYLDAQLSGKVARSLRQAAGDVPVLLKAGYFDKPDSLATFLQTVNGHASGIVLVNGMSRKIHHRDGTPVFGADREVAGVLGSGIHAACLANVREAVKLVERDRLTLEIAAVGGVLEERDAADYFNAGAAAVFMGGAPMFDPHLACRFKSAHPEW